MSKIFGYPHLVTVTTMKPQEDLAGVHETVPDQVIPVPCKVEPLSSTEIVARGLQDLGTDAATSMKVLCDSWPGGIYSQVEWNGRLFNQAGEAAVHSSGYFTRGVSVVITAQKAEFK